MRVDETYTKLSIQFSPADIIYSRHNAPGLIGSSQSLTMTTFSRMLSAINLIFVRPLLSAHIEPARKVRVSLVFRFRLEICPLQNILTCRQCSKVQSWCPREFVDQRGLILAKERRPGNSIEMELSIR